jgi:release factor glutamine methyltransferase
MQGPFLVENDLLRLAGFLQAKLQISAKHVGRCLQQEWISVNELVRTHKSALLATGDVVAANATAFQIAQVRFAEPLLQTVYRDAQYTILLKPAGMPTKGNDSVTVDHALPASMDDENYDVVDSVGRIASGPVIVSLSTEIHQQLVDATKRFTFQLIVHGTPPDMLDMAGFLSLRLLQTLTSTSGDLSTIEVVLSHSGGGLRGCLQRNGCPILGTSARTKSNKNGCFMACTKLELLWRDQVSNVLDLGVPEKFRSILGREQRFYEAKHQRDAEKNRQQHELRRDYVNVNRVGETTQDLLSNRWSVATFCGRLFYITHDVMSPKSSSEVLIRAAKEYLPKNDASVLDLGTGSGCLLVSTLVDTCPTNRGVGVDISMSALKVAEINIQSHGLSGRTTLQQGDFNDLSFLGNIECFDVILCNPPYLSMGECEKDLVVGPRVALVAENRGLACYEMVARQVRAFLKQSGVLVLEIGGKRKINEIRAIFGDLDHVETRLDDQGQGRCLVLRKYKEMAST